MKYKILLIASLMLGLFVRAQTDSSVSKIHFILKTNPTLAAMSGDLGEFGASLELNIGKRFGAFVGYGYNTTTPVYNPVNNPPGFALTPSAGNTIRAGVYYFISGRKFLSAQMFYRTWQPTTIFQYVNFNVTTDYATNKFGNAISSDESAYADYTVNTGSVATTVFDILFGNQIISNPNEGGLHLFMEWFVGIGVRANTINNEEFGTFHNGSQYYPENSPVFSVMSSSAFDFKLGIQIGLMY